MQIVLFEDDRFENFYPLSKTRPLHFLRCGAFLLYQKYLNIFPDATFYFDHRSEFNYLHNDLPSNVKGNLSQLEGDFLAINIRLLPDDKLIDELKNHTQGIANQTLLFGKFSSVEEFKKELTKSKNYSDDNPNQYKLLNYPWDLVNNNGIEICADYQVLKNKIIATTENFPNTTLVNSDQILLAEGVKLKAGVIIDATDGPVIIDQDAVVMHNSVIIGPCYIGQKCSVKIGAKIYEKCSFGPVCKIGGEIEGSIIHGYSNKQHDGFLGHAYLGEWCNLGADTNNSDLKNNYSTVSVEINGKLIDTGSKFVGLFMGDHSKTGINTMLNTGTVIGVCCSVVGEGFPNRYIADFNWGGKEKMIKYPFNRTIDIATQVKKRRGLDLCPDEISILKAIYAQ